MAFFSLCMPYVPFSLVCACVGPCLTLLLWHVSGICWSVQSCEVAAMFYWWLLFQKPDQIEVGEDGFKQWDGKTSLKTANDSLLTL